MDLQKFIEQNWKAFIAGFVGLVVVGAVFTLVSISKEKKETKAQEMYFSAEKHLLDLKSKKENVSTEKDKINEPVDFGSVKKELETVISEYPTAIASQMAAIHLSKVLLDEKNMDAALAVLQKVENTNSGMVNVLVQQQIAGIMADKEKCQEAIVMWQKIIDQKSAQYIHDEARLQQALCYAKMNNIPKAEEILTNLASKSTSQEAAGSGNAKEAEKFLKLLLFKKAAGT